MIVDLADVLAMIQEVARDTGETVDEVVERAVMDLVSRHHQRRATNAVVRELAEERAAAALHALTPNVEEA